MLTTYEQVADSVGLSIETKKRYVKYMRFRWLAQEKGHVRYGYAREWAERFKFGREYSASDMSGRIVLDRVVDHETAYSKLY